MTFLQGIGLRNFLIYGILIELMRRIVTAILIATSVSVLTAPGAFAAFNPSAIISDTEFTDAGSMTTNDIQNFLTRRGGAISSMNVTDDSAVSKPVSQAIFEVANLYSINPKVILVTLQKEMSLLTDTTPSQRQLDYAMGYGCPDSGGCKAGAAGLFRQIDFATWQFRQYFTNPTQYTFKVGGTYTFNDHSGSSLVTILNQATANLYNYTPHVYNGNYNFYKFYSAWFAKQYPDGTLVRVNGKGTTWLIQYGERRAFLTRAAFFTRYGNYGKIINITQDALENYPRGADIALPNYSLVQTPDGSTYLINGETKQLIVSQEVFKNLGFNPEEVVPVSVEDLANYEEGVRITNQNAYPTGALVRIKENGGITWIQQGVWHPILDRTILRSRFPNQKPSLTITNAELLSYTKGEPLTLRDGELTRVKGESGVCVISNGQRRCIKSRAMMNEYGYKMSNVITISPRVAELHPVGAPLGDAELL